MIRSGPSPKPYRGTNKLARQLIEYVDNNGLGRTTMCREAGYANTILTSAALGRSNMRLQTFTDICDVAGIEFVMRVKEK